MLRSTILSLSVAGFVSAAPVTVTIGDSAGAVLRTDGLFGADLAIWNPPDRYDAAFPALRSAGFNYFRFPDGSLSNEYHWNGTGRYDSTGIWIPSDSAWSPGFLGEMLYRGTSKENWGFNRRSNLIDGDTATFWWGNVEDTLDPPWFVLDLHDAHAVDSVRIVWGSLRPARFELAYWTEDYAPYPGAHQALENHWKSALSKSVAGSVSAYKVPSVRSRYFAVRFASRDLPSAGVQVRGFALFEKNAEVSAGDSVKIFALSTRAGDSPRKDWTNIKWNLATFVDYVKRFPGAVPVLCVPAGTGSVNEAISWMRYMKRTGFRVRDWQVGNELDGDWEEGGPLSARQYAARFLAFARAMKSEDPDIHIHGPLYSTHKFFEKGAGLMDGKLWMPEFLRIVGEAEVKDGRRYLDAVDMHTYPYWAADSLNASDMLKASMTAGPAFDSLSRWMSVYLQGTREVHLSEFSSTVLATPVTMRSVQATVIANMFAEFAVRFGDRGHALPWDVHGGLNCRDWGCGTISLTVAPRDGSWNLWGSLAPTAEYFGAYLAFREWARDGFFAFPAASGDSSVAAYALGRGDSLNVLLVNLSGSAEEVRLARRGAASEAEILTFGDAQYLWNGTDKDAFASPDMGPSGARFPAGDSSLTVKLPPFGLALAKFTPGRSSVNAPDFIQASLAKRTVLAGDTLDLTFTATQRGGMLTYGKITCRALGTTYKIKPDDGAWGASVEAVRVKIPVPASAKPVQGELYVEILGLGKKSAALRVPFRVRGAYRTTVAFETFDDSTHADWYPVANGNNATTLGGKFFGRAGQNRFIRHDFLIEQPPEQTWPNFAAAEYPVGNPAVKTSAGIVFDYATEHDSPSGYHELLILTDQVKDYDYFMVRLPDTHGRWVRDTVLWEGLRQEGWGKTVPMLDPTQIRAFSFRGRGAGKGYISLDNIYFLGESGAEVPVTGELRRLR